MSAGVCMHAHQTRDWNLNRRSGLFASHAHIPLTRSHVSPHLGHATRACVSHSTPTKNTNTNDTELCNRNFLLLFSSITPLPRHFHAPCTMNYVNTCQRLVALTLARIISQQGIFRPDVCSDWTAIRVRVRVYTFTDRGLGPTCGVVVYTQRHAPVIITNLLYEHLERLVAIMRKLRVPLRGLRG